MSDRDRLLFAAAAIGVAICSLVWSLVGIAALHHQPYERATHERASSDEYQVPPVSRAIPTPPREPIPDRNEWRDESDLQAQWKAADWTFWSAIISIGSTIAALLGLFFVRESLRLSREANNNARHAFEEAERPLFFVSIQPFSTKKEDREEMIQNNAEMQYLIFHNVGTRAAFVRSLRTVIGFAKSETIKDHTALAEIAANEKASPVFVSYKADNFADRIHKGEQLLLTGTLIYEDALGIGRERGFQFVAKPFEGLWAYLYSGFNWERATDPSVNYDRRIDDQRA